jgi:starch-binding outer membrane protein, SusD/RagB family
MKLTPALKAQYPASQVASIVVDADNYIRVYPNFTSRTGDNKLYLFPIPTQEITLNPNIKQNPGWQKRYVSFRRAVPSFRNGSSFAEDGCG